MGKSLNTEQPNSDWNLLPKGSILDLFGAPSDIPHYDRLIV